MKLFCISQQHQVHPLMPKVPVLEEVTGISQTDHNGNKYWHLAEYPFVVYRGRIVKLFYDQRDFAILPDQSADEMQEKEREAIVNLETVHQ